MVNPIRGPRKIYNRVCHHWEGSEGGDDLQTQGFVCGSSGTEAYVSRSRLFGSPSTSARDRLGGVLGGGVGDSRGRSGVTHRGPERSQCREPRGASLPRLVAERWKSPRAQVVGTLRVPVVPGSEVFTKAQRVCDEPSKPLVANSFSGADLGGAAGPGSPFCASVLRGALPRTGARLARGSSPSFSRIKGTKEV